MPLDINSDANLFTVARRVTKPRDLKKARKMRTVTPSREVTEYEP